MQKKPLFYIELQKELKNFEFNIDKPSKNLFFSNDELIIDLRRNFLNEKILNTASNIAKSIHLKDQINAELKQAMLNKDVFVRDTLRLVTSEIKRFEVDNRKDPADEDIVAILKRMAKQRKGNV